jgi:hypothetical protein
MLAMIYLGGDGIDVKFTRTLFQKNDYAVPGVVSLSFLIRRLSTAEDLTMILIYHREYRTMRLDMESLLKTMEMAL